MQYKKVEYLLNDLQSVYTGLFRKYGNLEPWKEWVESVRFFHKTEIGGVVLTESTSEEDKDQGIWYIDIYCPCCAPSLFEFKQIITTCQLMGCKYIYAYVSNERVTCLLKYFNFIEIDTDLYILDMERGLIANS